MTFDLWFEIKLQLKKKINETSTTCTLILALISPLSSLAAPESPDQFKKSEEVFIFPCDEIGKDLV